MDKQETLNQIKSYVEQGWWVFPVKTNEKTPLFKGGFHKASNDWGTVKSWFMQYPNCGWGLFPDPSGLLVLDCDVKNGASPDNLDLPETLTVKTAGGWHFYFKKPADIAEIGNTNASLPKGWDIRCSKGYVILPPSIHPSGVSYEWVDENQPVAELPENIKITLLSNHNSTSSSNNSNQTQEKKPLFVLPAVIHEGERRDTLYAYACSLRRKGEGMDYEEILPIVLKANEERCVDKLGKKSPIPSDEVSIECKNACNNFPKGCMKVPEPKKGGTAHLQDGSFTDVRNGQRFVEKYGDMLRFNKSFGWIVWDGKVWRLNSPEVRIFAQKTAESIFDEAKGTPRDTEEGLRKFKTTMDWAKSSLNSGRIDAMLKEASPSLVASTSEFDDNHPWLLNVKNGILDLKTGELLPHDPKYFMTKMANVEFDKNAPEPKRWLEFMEMIFPDEEVRRFVQKAVGYSLTGTTDKKLIFFLYGKDGDNGKSTFIRALLGFFGEYGTQTDIEAIMETRKGGLTPLNEDFYNSRFVSTNEIGENMKFSDNTIKALSGGDRVNCNPKNRDPFSFDPTHKLWIFGNKKPKGGSNDTAFWNRMMLIAFDSPIPKEKRRDMGVVLGWFKEEYSGILNWCLEGLRMMEREGMERPEKIELDTSAYKKENDVFEQFLVNECAVGEEYRIRKDDLFRAYEQFLSETQEKPSTKIALTGLLEQKKIYVGGAGRSFYLGITTQRTLGEESPF